MKSFLSFFRINDWWSHIIPPIVSFCLLGIYVGNISFDKAIINFILFYLLSIFTAAFGFFIGEWSDINDDEKANKKNTLVNITSTYKTTILITLLLFILLILYQLKLNTFLMGLVFMQYLCFCFYSLPPFRLKKNRFLALILDATYSGTLFYFIGFGVFNSSAHLSFLFIIWSFLKGLRNIISHLMMDKEHDTIIKVKTIANTIEINKIIRYSYFLLIFEILTFMGGLIVFKLWSILFSYSLFIVYWQYRDKYIIPYLYKRKKPIVRNRFIDFNYYYEFFFPLVIFILIIINLDEKYLFAFPLIILNLKFLKLFK